MKVICYKCKKTFESQPPKGPVTVYKKEQKTWTDKCPHCGADNEITASASLVARGMEVADD